MRDASPVRKASGTLRVKIHYWIGYKQMPRNDYVMQLNNVSVQMAHEFKIAKKAYEDEIRVNDWNLLYYAILTGGSRLIATLVRNEVVMAKMNSWLWFQAVCRNGTAEMAKYFLIICPNYVSVNFPEIPAESDNRRQFYKDMYLEFSSARFFDIYNMDYFGVGFRPFSDDVLDVNLIATNCIDSAFPSIIIEFLENSVNGYDRLDKVMPRLLCHWKAAGYTTENTNNPTKPPRLFDKDRASSCVRAAFRWSHPKRPLNWLSNFFIFPTIVMKRISPWPASAVFEINEISMYSASIDASSKH